MMMTFDSYIILPGLFSFPRSEVTCICTKNFRLLIHNAFFQIIKRNYFKLLVESVHGFMYQKIVGPPGGPLIF